MGKFASRMRPEEYTRIVSHKDRKVIVEDARGDQAEYGDRLFFSVFEYVPSWEELEEERQAHLAEVEAEKKRAEDLYKNPKGEETTSGK